MSGLVDVILQAYFFSVVVCDMTVSLMVAKSNSIYPAGQWQSFFRNYSRKASDRLGVPLILVTWRSSTLRI